jgi:hypothetical protein
MSSAAAGSLQRTSCTRKRLHANLPASEVKRNPGQWGRMKRATERRQAVGSPHPPARPRLLHAPADPLLPHPLPADLPRERSPPYNTPPTAHRPRKAGRNGSPLSPPLVPACAERLRGGKGEEDRRAFAYTGHWRCTTSPVKAQGALPCVEPFCCCRWACWRPALLSSFCSARPLPPAWRRPSSTNSASAQTPIRALVG